MFRFPLQRIVADLLDKYLSHSLVWKDQLTADLINYGQETIAIIGCPVRLQHAWTIFKVRRSQSRRIPRKPSSSGTILFTSE